MMDERNIKSFEDLHAWQFCRVVRRSLSELARSLPSVERYRLSDQIIRASRSVTNNIAEGYGRYNYQENIQFCRQSRGSLYELIDHLIICQDEGYISQDSLQEHKDRCIRAIQLVNGLIRYLTRKKRDG